MFTKGTVWRLYRKFRLQNYTNIRALNNRNNILYNEYNEEFKTLYEKHKDKIKFNSYMEHEKLDLGYYKFYCKTLKQDKKNQDKLYKERCLPPLPVALKYCIDKDDSLEEEKVIGTESSKVFQLPFAKATNTHIEPDKSNESYDLKNTNKSSDDEFDRSDIDKWMTNYEYFDDTKLNLMSDDDEEPAISWSNHYGTPDPNARVSRVPCGGCGALFHCSDPSIPGYLPSEIFKNRQEEELKTMECQRCHFLKEYNIALDVSVHPEEYEKLLQNIRNVKALVVMMVDLLDYPCSIWPGIVDIIGTKRPLVIVGNKVDLIPGDSIGYLKRIRESLLNEIQKTELSKANIKHVSLISAKTGYGVESLISALFKIWLSKGDVFLIGSTNVGKSSLFNTLLQSDYCKVHAVDIIKRATVSRWPGTTLNLLKFPINRPSGWKIYERTQRLKADSRLMKIEKQIRRAQIEGTKIPDTPNLIGHIGRSFSIPIDEDDIVAGDDKQRMMVLDEKDDMFKQSKWFYDTPGVMHPNQVLSLLTTEELLLTVPKRLIQPQTYYLDKGSTIFIAGLARIDFIDCDKPCRFTIFCSDALPITVTRTVHADEVYEEFVGTELFAVPTGGAVRLKNWPGLKKHAGSFTFVGEGPKLCCGDVVLSSIAWVSVTAKERSECKIAAWTPHGKGIHKRYPSMLPFAINLKGKRLRDTPAYKLGKVFIDDNYVETRHLKKFKE